jgi:hypothetical protein
MLSQTCNREFVYRVMAAVMLLLGIFASVPAGAQVAGGAISGTITDSSGAVVPSAQVSINNVAMGVSRTVTTNSDGFYTVPNLLPGSYEVRVTAPGFSTEVRSGINLTVGAALVLNQTMKVGATSSTVQVTTEAPAVELASSEISAVVSANTVRELPLNGRSWTDLATLQPGVDAIQTQVSFTSGSDRGSRGFGQQLTISGARPQQNNYRLDGVSINDYANGGPGSVIGGNLGVDAIQEFSVLTSNYSSEYGKTSGGVVNAITRSGTNQLHGGAYEFLRNSALDARNFFDASTIPAFKRNQFGGDVGGPIFKNRTFFFADYEGIRQAKGITQVDNVPTLDARNGLIHDSNGNPIPQFTVDPAAQKYLALYPLPNGGPTKNPDLGIFRFGGNQVVHENFVTTRVDHRFSEKDSLFGSYMFDRTPYTYPDPMDNIELGSVTSRQFFAVEETHAFTPRFVNSVRFGYNHEAADINTPVTTFNPAAADLSLGAFTGRNASEVDIGGGVSVMPGGVGAIGARIIPYWDSFQGYDDASLNKGTHNIKFGVAVERIQFGTTNFPNPNGIWNFGNLQAFLTNNPTRFNGAIVSTITPRDLRQTLFGAYVQDDWRWKRNLTLNLGLRYEMSTVPTEINGKIGTLRHLTDATPHLGDPYFSNPTLRDFEPRIGLAWDPFRNGKMAVRGGFGMFDVLPLPYQFFVMLTSQDYPFIKSTTLVAAKTTPPLKFFNTLPSPLPSNTVSSMYVDPSPKRNYVMQWNLNVQYQLTPSWTAMVAYIGSRGVHQPFRVDEADMVYPTKTSAGYLWPDPIGSGNRINPNFGNIRGLFYEGTSSYNALELQLAKRLSHGFQVQGSYTWGRSIDTSSSAVAGDAFSNSISSLSWYDPKASRGLSDFSIGHTLLLNGTWEVPTPKSFSGPARWLAEGWQPGLIFTASDGVPFTATFGTGGDPLGSLSGDDWDFPDRLGGSGCKTLTNPGNPNNYIKTQCFAIPSAPNMAFWTANCDPNPPTATGPVPFPQCFNLRGNAGRNALIGPGITEMDFSVFKNNYIKKISENFNVQFRAEFFNILNHANFAPPTPRDSNTDIFDASGAPTGVAGGLFSTTTTAREIQFALKAIW